MAENEIQANAENKTVTPVTPQITITTNKDAERIAAQNELLLKQASTRIAELEAARDNAVKSEREATAKAMEAARAQATALEGLAVKTALEKAMVESGLTNQKAIGLIKTDGVKVENGAVVGLDEKVKAFKAEFPEFFRTTVGTTAGTPLPPNSTTDSKGTEKITMPARINPKDRILPYGMQSADQKQYVKARDEWLATMRRQLRNR